MAELGIDIEEAKREKKHKKAMNKNMESTMSDTKQIDFILLPGK